MSVQSEIDRIITAVGNAYSKVSEKGGIVPASQTVANLATAIGSIPAGGRPSLHSKSVMYTSNGTYTITPDYGYDGLSSVDVMVNVASGGGGSAGFKVTFPATAANWNEVDAIASGLILSDGTVKPIRPYSNISGQTVENVVGIACHGDSSGMFHVLMMTLSEGVMAQYTARPSTSPFVVITTAPNTTATPYASGTSTFWWPLSDVVISSIEMYNTD